MSDKKKILIVEDEESLLNALVLKFKEEGKYEVYMAKNGEEGLNVALEKHPDIILLDILMPKMDGLDMVKELRKDKWGKEVEIIILTNLDSTEKTSELLEEGVYDYLYKSNWDLDDVVKKVNKKVGILD